MLKFKEELYLFITMKNYEILCKLEALKELVQIKLPVKASWNVTKNIRKFESSIKTYMDCEQSLVMEYALKNEDGSLKLDEKNIPKFAPNNKEKYMRERNELLNCEDTLDLLSINLSDLDGKDIKPATLLDLEFMIVDDCE